MYISGAVGALFGPEKSHVADGATGTVRLGGLQIDSRRWSFPTLRRTLVKTHSEFNDNEQDQEDLHNGDPSSNSGSDMALFWPALTTAIYSAWFRIPKLCAKDMELVMEDRRGLQLDER